MFVLVDSQIAVMVLGVMRNLNREFWLQFVDLMRDVKKRKKKLPGKLDLISSNTRRASEVFNDPDLMDELCTEATELLKGLKTPDKRRVIRDIIERVEISGGGMAKVMGHLPKFNRKVEYGAVSRNSRTAKCGEIYFI